MDDDGFSNLPDQKELEKELADYLSRKYGERVKVISAGVVTQPEKSNDSEKPSGDEIVDEFDFDLKPEDLIKYLEEYVIKQDEAKAILATKVCTHFNRIRYSLAHPLQRDRDLGRIKNNVLIIGPTGVGKTYLVKLIAQRLGVPFIKGDATKFSETGYVGGDVEDLVRDLVRQADGDIDRAQYGIIYVDEIDKIASSQNRLGADVSRTGVQRALLKPMEETEVEMKTAHDPISQIEAIEQYRQTGKKERRAVNTKNILFIMSGAFAGLDEIIRKRVQDQSIGFEGNLASKKNSGRFIKKTKAEDLIEFGFESEFVGRLPVVAVLEELSADDLYAILSNLNSSLVIGKKQDFKSYGIDIIFEDAALREIALRAHGEQTGARGLVSVIERVLLPFEKTLPSTEIKTLAINMELVSDPHSHLQELLAKKSAQKKNSELYANLFEEEGKRFEELARKSVAQYMEDCEVAVTPARLQLLARQCQMENLGPRDLVDLLIDRVDLIGRFAKQLTAKCEIRVKFSEEAIDRILAREPYNKESVREVCQSLQKDFEYGLCLMKQKNDIKKIVVPPEGVDDPQKYMEDLVSSIFRL